MKIDTSTWRYFVIGNLFHLESGKVNNASELADGDDIAYIGAKKSDNGVMRYVARDESKVTKGNCVIFICDGQGSIGLANYMESDFIGTVNVVAGYNDALTPKIGLFIATVFSLERKKYSYGRKLKTVLALTKIKLPATTDGTPDWQWMESYIDSLHSKPLTTGNDPKDSTYNLDISTWKTFLYSEIFDIRKGFYNKKPDHTELGNIPFLGAIAGNNGVTEYYTYNEIATATKTGDAPNSPIGQKLFPPNAVCVTNNGSVGYAYFQPTRFTCSHDVNPLYRKDGEFNAFTGQFVATVIMHDRYRWDYGRKWRPVRMINSTIKLPATPEGKPDWQYMENYIKSLPYGDRL